MKMEKSELLALLSKGVDAWNEWREANPAVTPDLAKADFRGAHLNKANFSGADLWSADFSEASCRQATFQGADLMEVDFRGADLSGAIFVDADLKESYLFDANARGIAGASRRGDGGSPDHIRYPDKNMRPGLGRVP